ncbi:hypothetical protein CGRA01v4_14006 [Colletotrichum graminicola]|nr:hypothetical protein CGRA01v4_14006 [Colletotrichum graminicola]
MSNGFSPRDHDFRKALSTEEPNASVHERSRITQLPGVFVPSCQNGSLIYPTTTQKNPTHQRRVSIVPPAPSTALNWSLRSHGDDVTMDWVPQASSVFRRPSRCMSVEETFNIHSHNSESVDEHLGEAEAVVVSGETNNIPASERLALPFLHDGVRPEHTAPTTANQPSSMTSIRAHAGITNAENADTIHHDPMFVQPEKNANNQGRSGYKLWGKTHIRMQRIMAKVRDNLAGNRKAEVNLPQETDQPATSSQESYQYVIDDSQVQRVVEIVLQEMCKHDPSSQSTPPTESYQPINNSAPKWLSRKPSCLKSSIEPQLSTTADPATTISEPETSFVARSASDGQIYSKTRPQQVPSTKIVCQAGSTDIQWLGNSGIDPNVPRSTLHMFDASTDIEPSHTPGPSAAHGVADSDGFSLDPQLGSKSTQDKANIIESVIHDDEDKSCKMTSFPALSKRHCTNEWLSPASFTDSKTGTDMYHLGIDARSSGIASITRALAAEQVEHPSEASDSLIASAESGKQRSAELADPLIPKHPDPKPGFMQKLTRKMSSVFQGSDRVGRPTRAPAPSETEGQVSGKLTEGLGASRPLAGDQGPDAGSFSEPEPDTVYQAMALLKPGKGEPQRRSTCSEDNTPHQCDDDLSTSEVPTPCTQRTP